MEGSARLLVERPRLSRLLDSLSERRLVMVHADASSGKTCAVRSWLAGRSEPVAWLTLHSEHAGPRELLAALVDASAPCCPGLAEALAPELAAQHPGAATGESDEVAAVVAGALAAAWSERAAEPFTVVLDDLHEASATPGAAFVATLVRLVPRTVQMILISRRGPEFPVERLRAAGQYGEVGQRALLFDTAETVELFGAAGVVLSTGEATDITAACAGWAGALRLAVEMALESGSPADVVARLSDSSAPQFLAAAALDPLDLDSRRHLRTLSVLGPIERPVLGTRPAVAARLDALAERGLLVVADGAGWSLSALAVYAMSYTAPPDEETEIDLLRTVVELAVDAGCGESALRWALQLDDAAVLADTVARVGGPLLDSGSPLLLAAAERMPVPVGDLRIDGIFGPLFALRGDTDRSVAYLDASQHLPVAIGWRVANALWMHGTATQAQQVLDRIAPDGPARPEDLAQLAAMRATLAWARGDGPESRRCADQALALARLSNDDTALGVAWVNQALVAALEGDSVSNRQGYVTALVHASAGHDVLTELRVRCNVGSRLTRTGKFREAVAELDEAVRIGEATGQITRLALARYNQGEARLGLGQIDEALQDMDAALDLWHEIGSPMAAYALHGRGDALSARGDPSRAADAYRRAIELSEREGEAQVLVPSLSGLARIVHAEDTEQAAALIERVLAQPASLGETPAYLAAGWIALCTGDRATATDWSRQARDDSARRNDPALLADALVLAALADADPQADDARLGEAAALFAEIGSAVQSTIVAIVRAELARDDRASAAAREQLRALGVRDSVERIAGPLAALAGARHGGVVIQTLGSFVVFRGRSAVPASAWQSRKARDLVKILAGRRGRTITRDALAELLWPGASGDASGNRLSIALSTARAVFDPDKSMPPDHYLLADRDAVRLNPRTVSVDADEFAARADRALQTGDGTAVALLQSAAAAYPGDFCEEDPYESWATQVREELRAKQLAVLRTLARTLSGAGQHEAAIAWYLEVLGHDAFDEQAHLGLVGSFVRSGRHGEARRAYRAYAARMLEIDIEPAAFPQRAPREVKGFPKADPRGSAPRPSRT